MLGPQKLHKLSVKKLAGILVAYMVVKMCVSLVDVVYTIRGPSPSKQAKDVASYFLMIPEDYNIRFRHANSRWTTHVFLGM
jgi:hypothetical protein